MRSREEAREIGIQRGEEAETAPQEAPVEQAREDGRLVAGEVEAFLGRARRMIKHEPEVPQPSNDRLDARYRRSRHGSSAGVAAFGKEKEQVEIGAGSQIGPAVSGD